MAKNTFAMISVQELNPTTYNPRKIIPNKYKKLLESIKINGILEPLVVNKDNTIIAGHQRYRVAKEIGLDELPCIVVDVDKVAEKMLNVQLNNLTGENDKEKLIDVLNDLIKVDGLDMEMTGFSLSEIEKMLDVNLDEKEAPDYPITPYFGEKYDYVIIFTKNEVDYTYLKNALGVETTQSYKSTAVGTCKVLTFDQFKKKWDERDS